MRKALSDFMSENQSELMEEFCHDVMTDEYLKFCEQRYNDVVDDINTKNSLFKR